MQSLVTIKVKPSTSQDQLAPLLKREAAKAWEMMASGVLRSAYYIRHPLARSSCLKRATKKKPTHMWLRCPWSRPAWSTLRFFAWHRSPLLLRFSRCPRHEEKRFSMNVLIVYAHEEPKSFNGAMRDKAVTVLGQCGHIVEVSDLYAMKFNPVGGRHDFTRLADPDYFKNMESEQTKATEAKTLRKM